MPAKVKRLRIFAGPNGSGKSTIIDAIRKTRVNGHPVDFGFYVNADDIARELAAASYQQRQGPVKITKEALADFAASEGFITEDFSRRQFLLSVREVDGFLTLRSEKYLDRVAQIIARYLREALFQQGEKFSFETVFSHPSNLDIMRKARAEGYKVYLYFVSTESPEINKLRVKARVAKGGHAVPEERIVARYYRSLELLFEASQLCHQVFYFDNSTDGNDSRQIAHFKLEQGRKIWSPMITEDLPVWFVNYYLAKALTQ